MSDELEVEDDVFLEAGVFYCTCGNPIDGHGVYLRITELCQKAFGAFRAQEERTIDRNVGAQVSFQIAGHRMLGAPVRLGFRPIEDDQRSR